jgi:hypothetical protein
MLEKGREANFLVNFYQIRNDSMASTIPLVPPMIKSMFNPLRTIPRFGRQVDNHVRIPEVEKIDTTQSSDVTHSHDKDKDNPTSISIHIPIQDPSSAHPIVANPTVRGFVPKAPFPDHRLARPKKGTQFGDILKVFKQVKINIPFLYAIQQVPAYGKFLIDMVIVKRRPMFLKRPF